MTVDASRAFWDPLIAGKSPIKAGALNSIAAAVLRLVQFNVAAPLYIRKDSSGYFIGLHPDKAPATKIIAGEITGNTPLAGGGFNRWIYSFQQMELRRDLSIPVWQAKPGGLVGTDNAINGAEAFNDGSGIEQLGVDMSRPTLANFNLLPIQNKPVVPLIELKGFVSPDVPGAGNADWWFFAPNAIDGDCPTPLAGATPNGSMTASHGLEIVNRVLNLRVGEGLKLDVVNHTIAAMPAIPLGTHPTTKELILDARAKGDLFAGRKLHESGRLSVGSDGQQVYADSSADLGVSYQTPFPSRITLLAVDTPISV